MSADIISLVIEEFLVILVWIIGNILIHPVCSLSGDFSGLVLFNTSMIILTALPVGILAFINR